MARLTAKQQRFVEEYTVDFNALQSAIRAGYSRKTAGAIGYENLNKPHIEAAIKERMERLQMAADEASVRMARIARFNPSLYIVDRGEEFGLDVEAMKRDGYGDMINGFKYDAAGRVVFDLVDRQRALETLFKASAPQLGDQERPVIVRIVEDRR